MGGQVADHGQILDAAGNLVATVTDVQKAPNGQALHTVEVLAPLALNQEYTLAIDSNRRHRVMKNHTATHLLHAALHNILGHHATQAGSLNEVEFLRFDFTHFQAVTPEELRAIEQQVNEKIWEAIAVQTVETDIDTAKEMYIVYSAVRRVVKGRCKRDGPVRHRAPGNFGQSLDRIRILVLAIHLYDHCTGT